MAIMMIMKRMMIGNDENDDDSDDNEVDHRLQVSGSASLVDG